MQQPVNIASLSVFDIGETRRECGQTRPWIFNIYSETVFLALGAEGYGGVCARMTYGERTHHSRQIRSTLRRVRHLGTPCAQGTHTQSTHGEQFGTATLRWRHCFVKVGNVYVYVV